MVIDYFFCHENRRKGECNPRSTSKRFLIKLCRTIKYMTPIKNYMRLCVYTYVCLICQVVVFTLVLFSFLFRLAINIVPAGDHATAPNCLRDRDQIKHCFSTSINTNTSIQVFITHPYLDDFDTYLKSLFVIITGNGTLFVRIAQKKSKYKPYSENIINHLGFDST